MKILLSTGFIPKKRGKSFIRPGFYPPFGLGCIAAVLEKEGYDVKLYDCLPLNYSVSEVVDNILGENPDIIGISILSTSYDGARQIAKLIKKRKKDVPIIFGGPHCTNFPRQIMEECQDVDFLMYGESEVAFPMLIKAILGKLPYCDVPQLCFRDSNGHLILNRQQMLIQDLDMIPFPAWHLFDRTLYSNKCLFLTSRGCSYGKCMFCAKTGPLCVKYRRRSVKNVIRELEFLYKELSYKRIAFFDVDFPHNEEWIIEFCDTILQKELFFEWGCNARVDTVTEKIIKRMSEAGCRMIRYGIESGNQSSLNYIKKGIVIEQVKDAIKLTKKFGIKTLGYFILALPKETPEMGKQTVRFAIDLDLDIAQFVPLRPLLKTEIYDLCGKEGEILDNVNLNKSYDLSITSPILIPRISFIPKAYKNKEEVVKILKFAYIKFYLRFHYIWKLLNSKKKKGDDAGKIREWFFLFIKIVFFGMK